MWMPIPWADNFTHGNLNPTDTGTSDYDMLSNALGKAIASLPALKSLNLSGTFDSSLFWPPSSCTDKDPDYGDGLTCRWKSLESIRVHLDGRRPSGGTYFSMRNGNDPRTGGAISTENESPPGYSNSHLSQDGVPVSRQSETESFSTRQHTFSIAGRGTAVLPDHEGTLSPVLEAFAKACGCLMPKLRQAELSFTVPAIVPVSGVGGSADGATTSLLHDRRLWGVWYFSPGVVPDQDQRWCWHPEFCDGIDRRRLFWDTLTWLPADDIHELFINIGAQQHGPDLYEKDVSLPDSTAAERILEEQRKRRRLQEQAGR
ncbi:uncharacterized protein B0I36DRAFT_312919 [Microdochium trichocladiopsis]|uniref:Uncharacterized protein n=1 Tax=Microdochium trichocladiopsis TaxID=1682393 RepID=A0A9P9C0V3_9PEZI|nr:uncharacterized protein B0I36DRAFT_312919 [Microdochium trichocladiopsis]KAH7041489.1 hypothetical protein B0I36DRAFT_312919 [Microdochium trichocladiopsis]